MQSCYICHEELKLQICHEHVAQVHSTKNEKKKWKKKIWKPSREAYRKK